MLVGGLMSRSIKFRNSTYLDSHSVVHGRIGLDTYLSRLGRFHCEVKSTDANNYVVFDKVQDFGNQFDRRIYFYIFCR